MYCPNCGNKLPDGAKFCGKCGARLTKARTPADGLSPEAGNPSKPPAASSDGLSDGGRRSGRRRKTIVIAAGIAAAVVIAAAVLAFIFISAGFPGSMSGGWQGDDDGVITVTFDCGTGGTLDLVNGPAEVSGDGAKLPAEIPDAHMGTEEEILASREEPSDETKDKDAGSAAADPAGISLAEHVSGSDVSGTSSLNYAPDPQDVTETGLAKCPAYPTREGYVFGGWYTNQDYAEEFDFSREVTADLTLYAKWLDADSEEAQLSEEDYEDFEKCTEEIRIIYNSYLDGTGYVAEEDHDALLDEIEVYVKEQDCITYYCREEDTIYLEFDSLLTYICAIAEEDTWGDPKALDVTALYMIEDEDQRQLASDDLTRKLELWGDMELAVHEDDYFTVENLMTMAGTDLLLWFGHGTQVSDLHSVLYTTEAATAQKSIEYVDLIRSKDVTIAGGGMFSLNSGYYCIKSKFVRQYFPDMEDALVVLNACKGGMDSYLSAAFLSIGAEAVIAYSDTVPIWYTYLLTYDVLRYMVGEGEDGTYHTVQEALALAKEDFGETGRVGDILEKALDDVDYGVYDNIYDAAYFWYSNISTYVLLIASEAEPLIYVLDDDAYNYTLWSGLEGSITIEPSLGIDPDELKVGMVNDITGATVGTAIPAEDGDFIVDRLDGGDNIYSLYVDYNGYRVCSVEGFSIARHRYTDVGELEIKETPVIVSVENEEGESVDQAAISFSDADGNSAEAAWDSRDSVYETLLLPGDYSVSVSAEGYEAISDAVSIGTDKVDLSYVLEEEGELVMIYASSVLLFTHGDPWTEEETAMRTSDILGEPDRSGDDNALTLGAGGTIILGFSRTFTDVDGDDITIFEVGKDKEGVSVSVSPDKHSWYTVGSTSGGTQSLDMSGSVPEGMSFQYIMLTDQGMDQGKWPGADIDAVGVYVRE